MMRSLSSAVAGLRSHQTKMDVIGNNIANVNTYGYKSSRVTFNDVYYQTLNAGRSGSENRGGQNPTQIGYGAQLSTIDVLMSNGGGSYTGRATDTYIDGDGFFTVRDADGNYHYTRLGNLTVDGNYLVDYAGNLVMGIPLNSYATGEAIQAMNSGFWSEGDLIPIEFGEAILTYEMKTTVNEPAYLKLKDANGNIIYQADGTPMYVDAAGNPSRTPVVRAVNAYGQEYEEPIVRLEGGKLTDITLPNAPQEEAYEKMTTDGLAAAADGSNVVYYPSGNPVYLDSSGNPLPDKHDISDRVPIYNTPGDPSSGIAMIPIVRLEGGKETKQYETVSTGSETKNILDCITSISIGSDGSITGITTGKVEYNGETIEKNKVIYLGKIVVATFANQDGLVQSGMSYFDAGANSGEARYTVPDSNGAGKTKAGYLEMANVEISQEFTDMITTQRGFQANTRIITVSDEMLQELVNLKR